MKDPREKLAEKIFKIINDESVFNVSAADAEVKTNKIMNLIDIFMNNEEIE